VGPQQRQSGIPGQGLTQSKDPIPQPDWVYLEQYGEEKFAAGWMSEEEAMVFLEKALQLYADGHPGSTHLDLKRQQA
jgi:hypothetical protein